MKSTIHISNIPIGQPNVILITPPKERQVDASALPTLIDDFIKTKRRQIAASSADGYMQDLAPFLAWWQHRQNPLLDDDSFGEMVQWIEAHYRNGFGQPPSAQMLWRTTKRVRQLLTWAHDKGYIPVSLTDMCPLYPDPGRDKYFPDADDLAAMIAACNGDTRLRDVALILFATATGARRFEIAAVEVTVVGSLHARATSFGAILITGRCSSIQRTILRTKSLMSCP